MTVEDRNEFRGIFKQEIGQALESAKAHTDASIQAALESSKAHTDASIGALRDKLTEKMRDMQTEMLRGLEKFARGNFSRFHTLETTQADVNTRLGLLEERLLAVEIRVPPQPPRQ